MLVLGNSNQQQVFVFTNHYAQLHQGASQITKAISITLFTATSHKNQCHRLRYQEMFTNTRP